MKLHSSSIFYQHPVMLPYNCHDNRLFLLHFPKLYHIYCLEKLTNKPKK